MFPFKFLCVCLHLGILSGVESATRISGPSFLPMGTAALQGGYAQVQIELDTQSIFLEGRRLQNELDLQHTKLKGELR